MPKPSTSASPDVVINRRPERARSTLARAGEVFSSGGFRRLFATRAVSQIGDGIFQLAAADLLLFDNPGSNPALTLTGLSAVTLVPFSLIAPFVGVFIDRWERRRILEIVPIVRAMLALLIGLGVGRGSQGVDFYVIVLIVLSANRLFLATMSAVMPQLVPEDDLLVANSVSSTGGSVANVIGLGIGAGLSAVIGGTQAAGVAAIAFALSALLARALPVHRGGAPMNGSFVEDVRQVMRETADGVRRLRESSRATFALSAVTANQFLVGLLSAAMAGYFISSLGLGVGAVGGVLGVLAVGIALGVAIVPMLAERLGPDRLIPMSFLIAAIAAAATATLLSRAAVIAGAAFVGIAYAMTKIPVDTIVQEEMPDSHRGRAFAAYDMLFNVARVAGTGACAAAVAADIRPRAIVFTSAAFYAAMIAWSAARTRVPRRGDAITRKGEQEARPTIEDGELVSVRTYAGHRGDVEPRSIVVAGEELPVDAVEWRAVEETLAGTRNLVFVVRVAGLRIRLSSGDESERWTARHLH